ncbi:MAG: hypothetical protein WCX73_01230 [Candidatus Pacearchaeota archaeon]|jgi:hypothetical protein
MAKLEKKRGVWLTIWLIIMLIANFFTALIYLIFTKAMASVYPNVANWVWYVYGLLALVNFIFVIFLFMWKKWPFFAFCGVSIIVFIMNLAIGLDIFSALFGFFGIIVLYLSMKSRWNLFK